MCEYLLLSQLRLAHPLLNINDHVVVVADLLMFLLDLVYVKAVVVGGLDQTEELVDLSLAVEDGTAEEVYLLLAVDVNVLHQLAGLLGFLLGLYLLDLQFGLLESLVSFLHPGHSLDPLLLIHSLLVQIDQPRQLPDHPPPVELQILNKRIPSHVQTLRPHKQGDHPLIQLDLVVSQVNIGESLGADAQMLDTLECFQEVVAEGEGLQLFEMVQALDCVDLVAGEVEDFELGTVDVLHLSDHIVVQEQALEAGEAGQVLDLDDDVVLEVDGLEVGVFFQPLDVHNRLVVQIQLVVHLWVLVEAVDEAQGPEVVLVEDQVAFGSSPQLLHLPGHILEHHDHTEVIKQENSITVLRNSSQQKRDWDGSVMVFLAEGGRVLVVWVVRVCNAVHRRLQTVTRTEQV